MTNPVNVRPSVAADIPKLVAIASETLFPGDMLADMIAPFLAGQDETLWLTATEDGGPIGFAFASTEPMTDRAWNLKAIAVAPSWHRSGAGRDLLRAVEVALTGQGARLLVVDTSGGPDQAAARGFYAALGYQKSGVIPAFWAVGEDKVTFYKAL